LNGGCNSSYQSNFIFAEMLTEEEKGFISYWEQNRSKKKRLIWQLAAGLPLAALLSGGIFITYFSEWYTRAVMLISLSSSGVLVVLAALILIVVFVVVFSAHHRWDMNEQRYRELLNRRDK
jgi:membrane protein YdbS with pleckstrin-like domain